MNQANVTNCHQHSTVYDECDGPKNDLSEGWVHISCNQQSCLPSFIFNYSRFLINELFQNISLYN